MAIAIITAKRTNLNTSTSIAIQTRELLLQLARSRFWQSQQRQRLTRTGTPIPIITAQTAEATQFQRAFTEPSGALPNVAGMVLHCEKFAAPTIPGPTGKLHFGSSNGWQAA